MTLANCRSCGSVVHLRDGGHGPACCDNADPVEFKTTARPLGGAAGGQGGGASATPPPISPTMEMVPIDDYVSARVVRGRMGNISVEELAVHDLCGFVADWLDFGPLTRWHSTPIFKGMAVTGALCSVLVGYHSKRIRAALREGGVL